jgi:hypothetical protein
MVRRFTRRQFPAVSTVDSIEAAEALKASCAVEEAVSDAILGVHVLLIFPDCFHAHFFKVLQLFHVCGVSSIYHFLFHLLVCFLIDRLIFDMESFVPEVVTEETVGTSLAVDAEVAVTNIRASVQVCRTVAQHAEHAFHEVVGVLATVAIDNSFILSRDEFRVIHVLGSPDCSAVVAVPRVVGTEGIITVLGFLIVVRDFRYNMKQVLKLIKEIPRWVVCSSVRDAIPGVGPPFLNGVHGTLASRRVHRQDRRAGE